MAAACDAKMEVLEKNVNAAMLCFNHSAPAKFILIQPEQRLVIH